jgi:D-glycero-D-manno-heptose 1,7-bisphosphate phosphatase
MAIHRRILAAKDSPEPTVFLDRDGVLIVDRHYLSDPDKVALIPGTSSALLDLKSAGFRLVGVSNQSGIGRKYFSLDDFKGVMDKMDALLAAEGVALDGFYFCPHAPEETCQCRKPLAGLLLETGEKFQWDTGKSWVIGDKLSDIQLGRNNGMGGILVATGHGQKQHDRVQDQFGDDPMVHYASDLKSAVGIILNLASVEDLS